MLSRPILRQRSSALSITLTDTMRILGYGRRSCDRKSYLGTSRTPVNRPRILSVYLTYTRQHVASVEDTVLSLITKILKVQGESSYLLES
jgi:hypothetical protein